MQRCGIRAIGSLILVLCYNSHFKRILNRVFGGNGNITRSGADSLGFVYASRAYRICKSVVVHSPFTRDPRSLRSEFAEILGLGVAHEPVAEGTYDADVNRHVSGMLRAVRRLQLQ